MAGYAGHGRRTEFRLRAGAVRGPFNRFQSSIVGAGRKEEALNWTVLPLRRRARQWSGRGKKPRRPPAVRGFPSHTPLTLVRRHVQACLANRSQRPWDLGTSRSARAIPCAGRRGSGRTTSPELAFCRFWEKPICTTTSSLMKLGTVTTTTNDFCGRCPLPYRLPSQKEVPPSLTVRGLPSG